MQRLVGIGSRVCRLSSINILARPYSTPPALPWFVDQDHVSEVFTHRPSPPHLSYKPTATPPLPQNTPQTLKDLHAQLTLSPHLELSTLTISQPPDLPLGPALPLRKPQGRRKRGATYSGESSYDIPGGIWSWVVMAQVKEGTENKGAIESVVRLIRKTLLTVNPPLPLPPNSKRRMHNGWAMVDAGDFAIHILSKDAKEKYFSPNRISEW